MSLRECIIRLLALAAFIGLTALGFLLWLAANDGKPKYRANAIVALATGVIGQIWLLVDAIRRSLPK
jgi:hypothetical protein